VDTYGFSGLPGGMIDQNGGAPLYVGIVGYWWATTEFDVSSAYREGMYSANSNLNSLVNESPVTKSYGFSVRCIAN